MLFWHFHRIDKIPKQFCYPIIQLKYKMRSIVMNWRPVFSHFMSNGWNDLHWFKWFRLISDLEEISFNYKCETYQAYITD